ncbi:uncharacterized protein LOC141765555 isoform X1 [Sebastes fasciatus]|uniref:uncharacterized protein LOC141765555 isoform X1 n=1 Tax=Sebastes fasciatus TaxID=394691 RepID=UPI003D9EBF91
MKMSKVQMLRERVNRRQSAAAEEILDLIERSRGEITDWCYSEEEKHRQHKLLEASGDSLRAEPPHIKEEQEELWSSQEREQLRGLEEDDITKLTFTAVLVKSEDEEEKAQSSQLLQIQADEQIKADEDCGGSQPARRLRVLVKQRLTAAVEEIFGLFETTLAEYDREIEGLQKLLEEAVKLDGRVNTADDPQLLAIKEEVLSEQQEWRTSLDQQDPEPPHIKEEQEELWSSQEGEQLKGLEEDDITKFPFTAVSVKSEDEEKAQSSQLHQRQTDEQMETGADGEDCGGSAPDRIFGPARDSQQESNEKTHSSDHDTENSDDYSQEMSQTRSGLVTPVEELCAGKPVNSINNMSVDTGGKPFNCSICGKGFSHKCDLERHLRFHTGEKPFGCVFCEKNFSEKTDLKRHIRVHTGEKPFSCSICGKIFSQNENLRRHERIHTGEKPFGCPVCTKKFTHSGALVVHTRIHTGEKPFGCSLCGKRYIDTGNLKKHMRVHTGEKPFSCSVCGRRFNFQSQVKNHKCSGESSVTLAHHS